MAAALMLSACDFAQNALVPSVTGQAPSPPPEIVPLDLSELGTPSNTEIGARITQFRSDLVQLQQTAIELNQRHKQLHADAEASTASYRDTVDKIKTARNGGAGRDDPAVAEAWHHAQDQLQMVAAGLEQMNAVSSSVVNNVATAAYLLQSIRGTKTASDATKEDKRQLDVLEDAAAKTARSLDRMQAALSAELPRHSHFVGIERANLAQMAPTGAAVAAAPAALPAERGASAQSSPPAGAPGAGLSSGRPFVVIRFDDPNVDYEPQLYDAVNTALGRMPNVAFDLVAVASPGGTSEEAAQNADAARSNANKVMRSLLNMGLPPERISLAEVGDPNIQTNEVRLYVR